jgi:hypothetical protein
MPRRRSLLLATGLLTLLLPLSASAQTPADPTPAPTPDTPSQLAEKANRINAAVAALEAKLPALGAELAAAESAVTQLGGSVTDEQRRASELLNNAKFQALSAYIRGDASSQPYAMALAMQRSSNDAAWSLGLIQVANRRTLDMVYAARSRGTQDSRELTDALTVRERARDAIARLNVEIHNTKVTSSVVAQQLTLSVVALAPGVIDGMTTVAYDAYHRAGVALAAERPTCGLRWELLAAIGRTESGHGMGRLDSTGKTSPPILGPSIGADTDHGEIDTDPARDHAVGPMQFIPSTWRSYGADGNGDGIIDINNIYDESLAAGRYLCVAAGSLTLNTKEGVTKAILSYNPNQEYLRTVGGRFESLAQDVAAGWFSAAVLPTAPAPDPNNVATGGAKPVDPGAAAFADTQTKVLSLFSATAPAVAVAAGEPSPAVCESPTSRLTGRTGMYRCTAGTEVLDPCVAAPYDLTLLACVSDPDQPVRLIKVGAEMPAVAPNAGPPFLALQLVGGDRCLAIVPANAPAPVVTPTTTTSTTSTTVAETTTTAVAAPTTTAAAPTTATPTSTSTTTTTAAVTTTAGPATTGAATTTTVAATTTTLPVKRARSIAFRVPTATAEPVANYKCASGAEIIGEPLATTKVWTVLVRQAGIAQRQVPVAIAIQ